MGRGVLVVCALLGCGSSEGAAVPDGSVTDGSTTSDATAADSAPYPLATLDDVCDGGPSGRKLMGFVRPSYSGTYTYPPVTRPGAPDWKGPTTPSTLEIKVAYAGGAITCTPKKVFVCPPGAPCAAPQPPEVSVELAVTFTTADGTLKESFVATAHWSTAYTSVSFGAPVPATKLAGTYPIAAGAASEVHLEFSGGFEGDASRGVVSEMTSKISFDGGRWTASASATDAGPEAGG